MVDPAFGAFPVADPPPVLEFRGHLDRQAGAGVDPATSWSLVGPPRTFTWSAFRLTKRGIGRPLTEPVRSALGGGGGAARMHGGDSGHAAASGNAGGNSARTARGNPAVLALHDKITSARD